MSGDEDKETNGGDQSDAPPRGRLEKVLKNFHPMWFTWCMNSGILGLLTHQSPYQFHGLKVISTVFYVFDLVFFVLFSGLFILRFLMYRGQAYRAVASEPTSMFVTCWPIAWMTLTSLTPLIVSKAYWGGYDFSILGYVMWWIAVVFCLVVLFWVFGLLIARQKAGPESRLSMAIILPAVSVSTAAVEGAFVVSLSSGMTARLAVPVIVVGYMLVGIGTLFGLLLSAYLFYEHLSHGWPPVAQTTTIFMFMGRPMGQGASALLQLGRGAQMFFGQYQRGPFITHESALAISAVSTMIALMLSGLGFIWLAFALYAMIRQAVRRRLAWNHTWNSIIFPTATLVTAMSLFSEEMDSPAFRVVETIMLIMLIMVFLMNLAFVAVKLPRGKL